MQIPPDAVLLAVDIQQAFDDPSWGRRNNPAFEANVRALQSAWRSAGRPIIHVRHDSVKPGSTLRPGSPGNAFRPESTPLPGETVIAKSVHSAFIGTALAETLARLGARSLVIHGIQTNYCVATTARMAANLGFRTFVVGDACATFGQAGLDGTGYSAELLHDVALTEMHGEFATVAKTSEVVAACGPVRVAA